MFTLYQDIKDAVYPRFMCKGHEKQPLNMLILVLTQEKPQQHLLIYAQKINIF